LCGIFALKQGESTNGKTFKVNTIYDYVCILKPFCLWMIENGHSTLPEKKIRNLKVLQRDAMTATANNTKVKNDKPGKENWFILILPLFFSLQTRLSLEFFTIPDG
jgi:hypothetical protein